MHLRAYLFLAISVLVWGVAPAFIRSFSTTIDPWDAMFIRLVSVAIMCLPFLLWSGIHVARKDWPRLLLVSWVGIFGYFLGSIYGFAYVKTGVGGILLAVQPLIISLLAAAIGTERLTSAVIAGLVISFAGAVYMFSGDLGLQGENTVFGIAMLLMCDVAFAINVVFSRALVQNYGALRVTILTMILAAVPALAFFRPEVVDVIQNLDRAAWGTLFFLGFIGTILVVIIWNNAVGLLPPASVGASLYVIPVLAALSGFVVLGESLTARTIIGGAIVLAGVALSEFSKEARIGSKLAGILAVTFAVSAWGMVPVATRYLVLDLPAATVMMLRVIPAGILGLLLVMSVGVRPMPWQAWLRIIIAAVIGNTGYQVLSIYGTQHIPASWTGMLFGLEPVFIALFAVLFAGDRVTRRLVGGMILALTGTIIMTLGGLTGTLADVNAIGIVLVTFGTMGWGIYTVVVRPVTNTYGALPVACLTLGVSAFPALLFATPDLPASILSLTGMQAAVITSIVLFCTVGGTVAWNFGLKHLSSAKASMFLYVQPVVAATAGVLLLGEALSVYLLAGGALIVAGVLLSQFGDRLTTRWGRDANPGLQLEYE